MSKIALLALTVAIGFTLLLPLQAQAASTTLDQPNYDAVQALYNQLIAASSSGQVVGPSVCRIANGPSEGPYSLLSEQCVISFKQVADITKVHGCWKNSHTGSQLGRCSVKAVADLYQIHKYLLDSARTGLNMLAGGTCGQLLFNVPQAQKRFKAMSRVFRKFVHAKNTTVREFQSTWNNYLKTLRQTMDHRGAVTILSLFTANCQPPPATTVPVAP